MGFVSNSSSTSFVVVGSRLINGDVYSKGEELIKAGRLYAEGSWCCEGVDFFKMTKKMFDVLMAGNTQGYMEFYDVQLMNGESSKIKKSDIDGDEFEVHIFDVDNHHTVSVEDFKDRYTED